MDSIEEIVNHYCKDEEIAVAIVDSLNFNGFGILEDKNLKERVLDEGEVEEFLIKFSKTHLIVLDNWKPLATAITKAFTPSIDVEWPEENNLDAILKLYGLGEVNDYSNGENSMLAKCKEAYKKAKN